MKRNSKVAGISLVALVITIIVLIILTGAVIVTFMEGGIIDRAKESVFKNDMRTYQEILALKRAENQMEIALGEKDPVEINASTLEEIQAIIPEFKEEYEGLVVITRGELSLGEKVTGEELSSSEELYLIWLSDLGIGLSRLPKNALAVAEGLEVGDYVAYTPDGEIPADLPINLTRQNINWRVLKNDGRNVTLISETPIDSISLYGVEGFLNGPSNIDETYAGLYSGSKGTARNLKVEDVNKVMGVQIGIDVKPNYSDINDDTVEMGAGATFGDVLDDANYDVSEWSMPDDNYRGYELGYTYKGSDYTTEENEMVYKLIFRNVADSGYASTYFLSSSCIDVLLKYDTANFRVRQVDSGNVSSYTLYFPNGFDDGGIQYCGRPIVVLSSDVEVSNVGVGGDTLDTAWNIK